MLVKDHTEGEFLQLHHAKLRSSIGDLQFEQFASLKTNEERFRYVFELPAAHEFTIRLNDSKKNLKKACAIKNEGNKAFQAGNYHKALHLYNESVLISPWTEETCQDFAIVLANRSAVLYHLKEYKLALDNIDLALSLNYPSELEYKVMDRKARCLLATQQLKDAQRAFQETLGALDKSKLPTDKRLKWQKDVQIMLVLLAKNKDICNAPLPATSSSLPPVIGSQNKQYKSASSVVNVEYKEEMGRFATAQQDISVGDVILTEQAYCSVLLSEYRRTHCFHCFKRLVAPIPCPTCDQVGFCCPTCQKSAIESHHLTECRVLQTLWESGASVTCLMALRILTQNSPQYFIDIKDKLHKQDSKQNKKEYSGSDYSAVYSLVSHNEYRKPEDFFHRTGMAVYLFRCLREAGYFGDNTINNATALSNTEELIGALLLHHLQLLQFNAHEISELQLDNSGKLENGKSVFLGGGLFPTLALFNHSCDPGIIRYFQGSSVVVRTIKNIKKGEMIAENYGPIFTQVRKDERQKTLKSQYWFDCSCIACVENWPLNDEMNSNIMRFRCNASEGSSNSPCDNILLVPVDNDDFMVQCSRCKGYTNIMKGLKLLQDTDEMFNAARKLVANKEIRRGLSKFIEILKLLDTTLAPPFKDYHLCQEAIRRCMLSFGNKYLDKSFTVKK